jgi:hypothetical protein
VIEPRGRITPDPLLFADRLFTDLHGARSIPQTADGSLSLSQWDVRELQKAKGAIWAATDILFDQLGLQPGDLEREIPTSSFGGQIDTVTVLAWERP